MAINTTSSSPINNPPETATLRRGVSKVPQSSLQIDISRAFPGIVAPVLKPLASENGPTPALTKEIDVLKNKAVNWQVQIASGRTVHLMEFLLPVNWSALKRFAQNPNNLPKKIDSCDNSRSLNRSLVKMVNDYLTGNLKDSPQDFLNVFAGWLQGELNAGNKRIETIQLFEGDYSPKQYSQRLYTAFGQLHTLAICLHKVSEAADITDSRIRERSAYLMQLYRLKDALSTAGVQFFVEKFEAEQENFLSLPHGEGSARLFRNALYAPDSAMARLVRLAKELGGLDSGKVMPLDPTQLKNLNPKLARLLRYSKSIYKEENPPTLVIVSNRASALTVYEACVQDSNFTDRAGALLLANSSQLKRSRVLSEASEGKLDFIVTSELEKVPLSELKGKIRIVYMPQQPTPIRDYTWIESLLDSASEVRAVLMPVEGSSDQGRRSRAKRLGTVPELKELEFDLMAPDAVLNESAAHILYPNVRMLFAMSQKIRGMFSTLAKNQRLIAHEVEEFTRECTDLHAVAATVITRTSDKRKFQKDLATHYCDRLTNLWVSVNQDAGGAVDENALKIFGLGARILQRSSGYRGPLTAADATMFRKAFSEGLRRFVEKFESQPLLPFEEEQFAGSPMADPRLAALLNRMQAG